MRTLSARQPASEASSSSSGLKPSIDGEPDSVGYDQIPQPDGTIRFYFEFAGREGGIERAESYDVILSIANWEDTPAGEWLREDPDNTWLKDEWVVTVTPEMKGEAQ